MSAIESGEVKPVMTPRAGYGSTERLRFSLLTGVFGLWDFRGSLGQGLGGIPNCHRALVFPFDRGWSGAPEDKQRALGMTRDTWQLKFV